METEAFPELAHYPSADEVDAWVASVWAAADGAPCHARVLDRQGFTHSFGVRHMPGFQYVKFEPEGMETFYGYWQPALSGPAPLLVHVPGYGTEMSAHPELAAQGFSVLHVSPLGFATPDGANEDRKRDGTWPVLPDTVLSDAGSGYRHWLANCIQATRWAMGQPASQPDRVSFFGSSQGGGGSLLLGSLFRDRGIRCVCADVAFLTNFPLAHRLGSYALSRQALKKLDDPERGWRALGLIDTLSHVHRLTFPVLLTAAGADTTCPPATIESLFGRLPATRCYAYRDGVGHRYTTQFIPLASAWFRLHA
jgi:cephalosporin-C deacetylase-like acetyl esterase